jgi:hypothetical protein
MVAFNKINQFLKALSGAGAAGQLNLNTDGIKDALLDGATPPLATDTAFNTSAHTMTGSGAAEVANGNGYTAGGNALGGPTFTLSGGTGTLNTGGDPSVWTASGGTIGPLRYVLAYDTTAGAATTRTPIGWWDYGSQITLQIGETFTVTHTGAAILTIA